MKELKSIHNTHFTSFHNHSKKVEVYNKNSFNQSITHFGHNYFEYKEPSVNDEIENKIKKKCPSQ